MRNETLPPLPTWTLTSPRNLNRPEKGSNGFTDTSNVLLYGGSKSLMGYNKHTIGNMMAYVDLTPALNSPTLRRVGWSAASPETKPPMCSGFIVPTPDNSTHADTWSNNTCIATSSSKFLRFLSCNATDPTDGSIPVPLSNNRYYSQNATYVLECPSGSSANAWNLTEAQSRGLDVGSSLHELPTIDELLALMRALLYV